MSGLGLEPVLLKKTIPLLLLTCVRGIREGSLGLFSLGFSIEMSVRVRVKSVYLRVCVYVCLLNPSICVCV